MNLYTAYSEIGNPRREGKKRFYWHAFRQKPIGLYNDLIEDYGRGFTSKEQQEKAIDQLFREDEIEKLRYFLHNKLFLRLVDKPKQAPIKISLPYPIFTTEGVAFNDWDIPIGKSTNYFLFEEEDYDLDILVYATVSINVLPGTPLSMEKHMNALLYFEELFENLGFNLHDSSCVVSMDRIIDIFTNLYDEKGWYIHKFGDIDDVYYPTHKHRIQAQEQYYSTQKIFDTSFGYDDQDNHHSIYDFNHLDYSYHLHCLKLQDRIENTELYMNMCHIVDDTIEYCLQVLLRESIVFRNQNDFFYEAIMSSFRECLLEGFWIFLTVSILNELPLPEKNNLSLRELLGNYDKDMWDSYVKRFDIMPLIYTHTITVYKNFLHLFPRFKELSKHFVNKFSSILTDVEKLGYVSCYILCLD